VLSFSLFRFVGYKDIVNALHGNSYFRFDVEIVENKVNITKLDCLEKGFQQKLAALKILVYYSLDLCTYVFSFISQGC